MHSLDSRFYNHICLLFSGFSNVYHSACVWPRTLKLGCITNLDTLFLAVGFISLVSEIQFMLISSRRICIRYMEDQKRSNKDEVTREMTTWYCFVGVTWVVVSLQSVQTDVFPPLVQRELALADETQVRAGTLKRRGTLNISLLRMCNCSVGLWREKVCDRKNNNKTL